MVVPFVLNATKPLKLGVVKLKLMQKTCECGHTFEYKPQPAHRVLCGDSTQEEAVLMLMDGKKADMVFTDPPYRVNYAKKNKEVLGAKEYTEIKNDDKSIDDTAKDLWKPTFDDIIIGNSRNYKCKQFSVLYR